MKDVNVQILAGVAIIIMIVLIIRSKKPKSDGEPAGTSIGMEAKKNLGKLVAAFKEGAGIEARFTEYNEDKKILVGIAEACPAGYMLARPPKIGDPGCHITCGGGGICGSGPKGLSSGENPEPIMQKCCVPN